MPLPTIAPAPVRAAAAPPRTTSATPRLAPELMPSTNGSASGLRNSVCISSPATASAAPASTAVAAGGHVGDEQHDEKQKEPGGEENPVRAAVHDRGIIGPPLAALGGEQPALAK